MEWWQRTPPRSRRIATGILASMAAVIGLLVFPMMRARGVPSGLAFALCSASLVSFTVANVVTISLTAKRRPPPRGLTWVVAAAGGAFTLLLATGVLTAIGVPTPGAVALAAGAAAIQWRSTYKASTILWLRRASLRADLVTVTDARRLRDQTDAALAWDQLPSQERDGVLANRAKSMTFLSAIPGERERLDEAMTIVRDVIDRAVRGGSEAPQWVIFDASLALVDAWDFNAARSGDDEGWQAALDLMADVVSRASGHPQQVQTCEYHAARLRHGAWQIDRLLAEPDPDPEQFTALVQESIDAGRQARDLVDRDSDFDVDLLASYASMLALRDRERAVEVAREALASATRRQLRDIAFLRLNLAGLLSQSDSEPLGRPHLNDLLEADDLLADVLSDPSEPLRPVAAYQRALLRVRLLALETELPTPKGEDPTEFWSPSAWFRVAEEEAGTYNAMGATRRALDWARWAAGTNRVAEAAEAYQRTTRDVQDDLSYRYGRAEALELLATVQGSAAEAGYWLLEADRLEDALEAVESVRTLLLSERVSRRSPLLKELATKAGANMVWDRYSSAVEQFEAAERLEVTQHPAAGGPRTSSKAARAGNRRDRGTRAGAPDELRTAWSHLRRARQDLDAAFAAPRAGAWRTTEVARSASIVYVGAAARAGWAVRVDPGRAPRYVRLPEFTAQAADDLAGTLRRLVDENLFGASNTWVRLLSDLGRMVTDPALEGLSTGATVTFLPVGRVALLPLHLALTDASGESAEHVHVLDRYDVSFGPSRRLLNAVASLDLHATRTTGHVFAASVARPIGELQGLPLAPVECASIKELYGARATHAEEATRKETLGQMDGADVWHLACHATFSPERPLETALHLADGPITLAEMLTSVRRSTGLAVLSACDSGLPDPQVVDESLSFPAVLMASGVRATVAALWPTNSIAATVVSVRFHQEMQAGASLPQALGKAQRFLRDATNGDLWQLVPRGYPVPPYITDPKKIAEWAHTPAPFRHPGAWGAFQYHGN